MSTESDKDPFEVEADRDPFATEEMPEGWEPGDDEPFRIVIPEEADFIITPVPVYDMLVSGPCDSDPWVVWGFLWRCARRQGTRSVWATNAYIARGTKLPIRRIKDAKAWMAGARLIAYHQGRGEKGRAEKSYTTIMSTAVLPAAHPPDSAVLQGAQRSLEGNHRCANRCASDRCATGSTVSALGDSSSSSSCSEISERREKSRADAREAVSISFAARVRMTEAEYGGLVARHGGMLVAKAIEMLDGYKEGHDAEYDSDAGALKAWAIDAARKRLAELQGKSASPPSGNGSRRTCPKCGVAIHHNASYCLECRADLPGHEAPAARKEQAPPPLAADAATPEDVEAMRRAVTDRKPQSTEQTAEHGGAT